MANVNVTSDAWTEISITSGTIQNISATADIELSAEQTDNSGVVLKPSEIYQWDNETIYARAVTESAGALRVVNFKKAAGGGGGYVLPVASSSTLGGVKVGNNLSIDASGVLSSTGGATVNYSTTEQQIGTWINGKPLYQITYNATAPSTINTAEEIAELPANVDSTNVIDAKFILYTALGYVYPTSFYLSATDMDMLWIRANKKIVMQVGAAGHTNATVYITIQYTKTTD